MLLLLRSTIMNVAPELGVPFPPLLLVTSYQDSGTGIIPTRLFPLLI